jgi:hypothetical protein
MAIITLRVTVWSAGKRGDLSSGERVVSSNVLYADTGVGWGSGCDSSYTSQPVTFKLATDADGVPVTDGVGIVPVAIGFFSASSTSTP